MTSPLPIYVVALVIGALIGLWQHRVMRRELISLYERGVPYADSVRVLYRLVRLGYIVYVSVMLFCILTELPQWKLI